MARIQRLNDPHSQHQLHPTRTEIRIFDVKSHSHLFIHGAPHAVTLSVPSKGIVMSMIVLLTNEYSPRQ